MNCLKANEVVEMQPDVPFVDHMRELWNEDFRQSAFLKDIPRLAKRIQIMTSRQIIHESNTDQPIRSNDLDSYRPF